MKNFKWLSRMLFLVAFLATIPLMVSASPSVAPDRAGEVDAALQQALAGGQSSDLVIEFVEQADLSAAYGMNWQARGDYVVKALQATTKRTQANAIAYLDKQGVAHHTFLVGNLLYVKGGSLQVAEHLASLPGVARVRAPITIYLDPIINDIFVPQAITAWGILDTKADQFWSAFGVQGDGMVVSNIDTGVQWDHPALVNAFKCPGDPSNPACWADPSNICGGSACDNHGHGTHTMGTMVADDNPSLTYIAGMAPNAQWIACKGCESSSCSDFALNTCADWILAPGGSSANRPHVVNNSWGGGGGDNWYLSKVNAWRAAGIFPAFSAGNSGSNCGTLGSPGDYQESFGTAAHSSSRLIATFSSRGPSDFGHEPYTKPNISAPGVSVCSTVPTNSWSCGWSGTSMASPHSAGAVALLWSCNSSLIGQIDQTFQALQGSTDVAPAGNCGAPPDGEGNYTYGYGYLNVLQAGNYWCGGTPPTPTPTTPPGVMHVDDIQMSYVQLNKNRFQVSADVTIKDQYANPVNAATVSVQWTMPGDKTTNQQDVTGTTGVATFSVTSKAGAYQICVTDVVKSGWTYDPNQNVKTCENITAP
jgi:subtilisin family serine protease